MVEALSARVYAEVCREFRNILHTWLNRVHFSLAINYIYLYRLEQVHVQQFGSVWTKVKTDVSLFPFRRPWSLSGTGAHGRMVRRQRV